MGKEKVIACYVNFIALLVVWVILLVTGLVLWLVLPSGAGRFAIANYFLGFKRSSWAQIHLIASILFNILAAIHLVLNYGWIKNVTKYLLAAEKSGG